MAIHKNQGFTISDFRTQNKEINMRFSSERRLNGSLVSKWKADVISEHKKTDKTRVM
jgi:hypothetical protein